MADYLDFWRNARPGARTGIGLGAVLILLLALAAVLWLLRKPYDVLFTDMESQDAATVVSELERLKVPFQLQQDGTQVSVPEGQVHETRLKLMSSGLPLSGGVGFEIFDSSDFGMTEFAQRVNFQRALQGELTRTISSLQEVRSARVHLVLPEASLFSSRQDRPSASVTLFLKNGGQPSEAQISGIQALVAAAVPGLEPGSVTVSDQQGRTLSRPADAGTGVQAMSTRLEKKREVEDYLRRKIVEVVEPALGRGRVMVSVDATLNFDQVRTTLEDVLPGSGGSNVLRRRESRVEGDATGSEGTTVTSEVEYQHGRKVAQIVEMPGTLRRLSIGIVVPPETPEWLRARVQELAAMAVGLDGDRGDAIVVYAAGVHGARTAAPRSAPLSGELAGGDGTGLRYSTLLSGRRAAPMPEAAPSDTLSDEVQPVPDDPMQFLQGVWRSLLQQPALAAALAALPVAALLGALLAAGRRRRMPAAERDRLLLELRDWLADDTRRADREDRPS